MPFEHSKSVKRRYHDGDFHSRYFVGHGIDIGGKPDPLSCYVGIFPLMHSVRTWDIEDGDANYMQGVVDNSLDFVASSHCLEHMVDPKLALAHWIRIVKPGGHLIITIPDEDMYEGGVFPSRYNPDHKWTFTMHKIKSWSPKSINVLEMLIEFSPVVEIEKVQQIKEFFRPEFVAKNIDQTLAPNPECCLEFILKKR
ncbi:MAG: class I SAM-dependent methyltransferase [Fibrobacterales bacterium]